MCGKRGVCSVTLSWILDSLEITLCCQWNVTILICSHHKMDEIEQVKHWNLTFDFEYELPTFHSNGICASFSSHCLNLQWDFHTNCLIWTLLNSAVPCNFKLLRKLPSISRMLCIDRKRQMKIRWNEQRRNAENHW